MMSGWTPLVAVDTGSKSESEQAKEISGQEWRQKVIALLCSIESELKLLNARTEEGLETHIEASDV